LHLDQIRRVVEHRVSQSAVILSCCAT
jgi:hypothetical protein